MIQLSILAEWRSSSAEFHPSVLNESFSVKDCNGDEQLSMAEFLAFGEQRFGASDRV